MEFFSREFCIHNELQAIFTTTIFFKVNNVVEPTDGIYRIGKLFVLEETKEVYEKLHNEIVKCDRIQFSSVLHKDGQTTFAFDVLTKDKTSFTNRTPLVAKTKSFFHAFYGEYGPGWPTVKTVIKKNIHVIDHSLESIDIQITKYNGFDYLGHNIDVLIYLGNMKLGEGSYQINAVKFTRPQSYQFARCVALSAYATISYLTQEEVSE